MTFEQRRKRFVAAVGEGDDELLEPITVDWEGHPPLSKVDWEETFLVVPVAPAAVLDDLVASVVVDAQGRRKYHAPSLLAFMRGVLIDDSTYMPEGGPDGLVDDEGVQVTYADLASDNVARFEELVRDKNRIVPVELLGDTVVWLSDEVMGRPISPSSSSSNGRRGSGRTSERTSKHSGSKKPK